MNRKTSIFAALAILLSLFATTALFAEERIPLRETFIIRDGRVIESDGEPFVFVRGGKRTFLGVALVDLTPQLREHYGASKDSGVLVGSVEAGSPAEKAGLKVGDIVLSIDGKEIDSSSELRAGLRDKKSGDTVRIDVLRGRGRQTVVATLAEQEVKLPRHLEHINPEELQKRLDGTLRSPEWRARIESIPNCVELQARIRELETRLKDLEKKLQK